jgi:dynein heavy chain 1
MFEVQDLRYATLATVSRCGMVWFSEDVLSVDHIFENFLLRLRNVPVEEGEEEVTARARGGPSGDTEEDLSPSMHVCFCRSYSLI